MSKSADNDNTQNPYVRTLVCSYDRGLVGNASVVTDLWGTAQGITLNLSVLDYLSHLSGT